MPHSLRRSQQTECDLMRILASGLLFNFGKAYEFSDFYYKEHMKMRELTFDEISQVTGGILPALIVPGVIGAATGGIAGGVRSGGNVGDIVMGATLGAAAGFFGTVATMATGAARVVYSGYAIGAGAVATWNDS